MKFHLNAVPLTNVSKFPRFPIRRDNKEYTKASIAVRASALISRKIDLSGGTYLLKMLGPEFA